MADDPPRKRSRRAVEDGTDMFTRRQVRQDMKSVPQRKAIELLRDFDGAITREAQRCARRTRSWPWFGVEDYTAVGQIAVMEAWVKFSPNAGATFKTWVGRVLRWRMAEAARRLYDPLSLDANVQAAERAVKKGTGSAAQVSAAYIRRERLSGIDVSGSNTCTRDRDARTRPLEETLPCPLPNPEQQLDATRQAQRVQDSIRTLDVRKQLIITAEMHGPPATELAGSLGVSRARLYHQRGTAHDDLREALHGLVDDLCG